MAAGTRGVKRRRCERPIISVVTGRVALLASVAALAAGTGASAKTHPVLALAGSRPVVLKGHGFRPYERVRVTLEVRTTRVENVRAAQAGSFRVVFPGTQVPRCGGMFARARGASGSLAVLKIPLPACQPA